MTNSANNSDDAPKKKVKGPAAPTPTQNTSPSRVGANDSAINPETGEVAAKLEQLRVRLISEHTLPTRDGSPENVFPLDDGQPFDYARRFTNDLVCLLAIDQDEKVEILSSDVIPSVIKLLPETSDDTGENIAKLFAAAAQNTLNELQNTEIKVEAVGPSSGEDEIPAGEPAPADENSAITVNVMYSDSYYTAAVAAIGLAEFVDQCAPDVDVDKPFLFSVPNRHAVIVQQLPTDAETFSEAIQLHARLNLQLMQDDSGPIAPHVFLYRDHGVGAIATLQQSEEDPSQVSISILPFEGMPEGLGQQ